MMRPIQRIADLATRMPEHGRIRLGEKHGGAMRSIDHWRFTSPDSEAIKQLAELFGGTARPWNEPKAAVKNQWEVKTTTSRIEILLPPGGLSVWYEQWTAGGCARRCDGELCTQYRNGQESTVPCLCSSSGRMDCKPTSRLSVILPFLRFGGTWRMETKGWNAAHELSGMEYAISTLQEATGVPLRAELVLERRTKVVGGKTKNFVVPRLGLLLTPEQLVAGQTALSSGVAPVGTPALMAASNDDEVVDAEIDEEDDEVRPKEWAEKIQATYAPKGDTVLDRLHDTAAEVLRQYPAIGRTDEEVLTKVCLLMTKGETDDVAGLDEVAQQRMLRALQDIVDGQAEPRLVDDALRIVRKGG